MTFLGKKHKAESNKKRAETIRNMYASGKIMGFRSEKGKEALKLAPRDFWKGKRLPYPVWNKGKKGLQVSPIKGMKLPERSGEKSSRWKGGITPLRQKIKQTDEWKRWIKTILERDGYKCVWCGKGNNRLHVDHIIPYALIRRKFNILTVQDAVLCEELWDTKNGRTLCIECHKTTDTYLSKSNSLVHEYENNQIGI